jgi:hypothetical protein
MSLWFVDPQIRYRVNKGTVSDIMPHIHTWAGHESLTSNDVVDTVIQAIPTANINDLELTFLLDAITHDVIPSANTTTIPDDGTTSATVTTGLSNSYHALAYVDGELMGVWGNETGDFPFASDIAGAWSLLFIDTTTYETATIDITVTEA